MEKITYRLTLDTFKGGIQKVLRGVYTGDVLSRRVAISLSAGSVPCKISDEESIVSAVMYVTKPSGVTNYGNCEILDNVVYYDIIQYDVDVEGIVEMQLKVMSEDSVLYAPVFALEVQQSKNSDIIAEQSPQFTALEAALARAEEVYRKRLVSIELTDDLVFIAHYGDNSTYESDAIKNALAFVDDAERARVIAENERVLAEEQRVLAELERVLAEQRRDSNYNNLWASLNEVIEDTEELQRYVESLVEEGFITESRVLELIEEHGGGAVPDNVLVASEESAQTEPAPKVNADLFGGMEPSDFASADDIEDIINGTTQVGNALTLGGHGAEYFGKSSEVTAGDGGARGTDTDISDYRQKMVFIGLKEGTAINLPVCPYSYVFGLQGWLDESGGTAHELAFNDMGIYRRRIYDDNTKTNWVKVSDSDDLANYLPLTGGKIDGTGYFPLEINGTSSYNENYIRFSSNGTVLGCLGFCGANNPRFVSTSGVAAPLLHTGNMAEHVLPKSGGKLNGTANIGYTIGMSGGSAVGSNFYNADGTQAGGVGLLGFNGVAHHMYIGLHGDESYSTDYGLAIYEDNITWKNKALLHTGNKPSGSYTGNGDATERIIDVGNSISTLYAVFSTKGIVFVTGLGFYDTNGNRHENMSVYQGKLHIATINDYVNANGETYYYVGL